VKIAVLGIGQMGLVCSGILAARPSLSKRTDGEHEVVLWAHSAEEAGQLTQTRRSPRLAGFALPEAVRVTASMAEAVSAADLIVSAIPVQYIREAWQKAAAGVRDHAKGNGAGVLAGIVSVAKGIENRTLLRPTQIVAECLGDNPDSRPRPIAVLSGPTIAAELARCLPATMIAASEGLSEGGAHFSEEVQRLFATSWLRIYTSEDMLGVELAGAMKNVIAIAAGVLDGLQAGYNAKSALLARGLAEITRLGTAMGASQSTFFGLAGVGDLATTCFSPEGRNRSCGEALGRGEALADYLKRTTSVVEGVATTRSVVDLAKKYRVDMPITEAVHSVLFEGVDPIDAIGRLMSRELKRERVG
jgi:glycerol-3-phosphate dehydrogenase (NAD(P)+)